VRTIAERCIKLALKEKKNDLFWCDFVDYSTVTDFARLRGLSTSVPLAKAV
jgi:hypothetical protein